MRWAILDTSAYINHWERGLGGEALRRLRGAFVVRQSSVVLSELRRGARTAKARALVDALFRIAPVHWAPTPSDWWEAGSIIRRIGDRKHWDLNKRRDFQNDTLITLTARRHGATVVTADRDFELLGRELRVTILML